MDEYRDCKGHLVCMADAATGQQVDVLLCHAPIPPQAVKAVYQHYIHLSGKNGLRQLLQSRTIKGQFRAILGGNTNDGVTRPVPHNGGAWRSAAPRKSYRTTR